MAIVDVVVIPVGTEGPSISKYIAEIQTKLNEFKQQGKIDYQLTPMNTLIEGDLKDLFEQENQLKNEVSNVFKTLGYEL